MCGGRLRSVEGDRARKPRPAAIFPNIPNRDPRVGHLQEPRKGWLDDSQSRLPAVALGLFAKRRTKSGEPNEDKTIFNRSDWRNRQHLANTLIFGAACDCTWKFGGESHCWKSREHAPVSTESAYVGRDV